MRRSPRRRVTPRASSSLASGSAYLRRRADGVAEVGHREAVRAARRGARRRRRRRRRWRRREPDAVALDDQPAAGELAQLGPVDAVRRQGARSRRLRATATNGCPASGSAAPASDRPALRHLDAGHERRARPLAARRAWRRRGPSGPAAATRSPSAAVIASTTPAGDDPRTERRAHAALPSARRVRRRRSIPARRSPARRCGPVAAFDAGSTGATSSTSPPPTVSDAPALAEHVAVARQERERRRQVEPHQCRRRPERSCVPAEHPHADGMLARADVGDVGAAARHTVVERGRAP